MFAPGGESIIRVKTASKKPIQRPSESRFPFIRTITDRYYRDPYKWGLIKCVTFFAASVFAIRAISDLDVLPADPPSPAQASY